MKTVLRWSVSRGDPWPEATLFDYCDLLRRLCLTTVLMLTARTLLYAGAGTTAAEFLLIGTGARAAGMGEAFVAVVDDVNAVYWNPGALSKIQNTQITFTHHELLSDIRYEYVAIAKPVGKGTFGASVSYLHMGDLVGRNISGAKTGDFSAYDMAGTLSYGRIVREDLSLGITGKFLNQHLADASATGVAADVGLLYQTPLPFLTAAVMIQHLGPGQKFDKSADPLPLTFRVGLGAKIFEEQLILGFDVSKVQDAGMTASFGAEYLFKKRTAFRLGYQRNPETESSVGLSAGAGFSFGHYNLDYAFVPFSDLGDTHRFSLTAKF